jgi:hypothetical protein
MVPQCHRMLKYNIWKDRFRKRKIKNMLFVRLLKQEERIHRLDALDVHVGSKMTGAVGNYDNNGKMEENQ